MDPGKGAIKTQRRSVHKAHRLVCGAALPLVFFVQVEFGRAAAFSVTNTDDSGAGSLRQAVLDANAAPGADTITFGAGATGTITLTSGQLTVTENLTINGPGAASLTISGNNSRVLEVSVGAMLDLKDVTVADGYVQFAPGAGILNAGSLDVTNTTFSGNFADQSGGGGIANSGGTVTVTNSIFSGNFTVPYDGGGISNSGGGSLTVVNTTFSGNSASDGGGAIDNSGGTVTVIATTFSGNGAGFRGGAIDNAGGTLTVDDTTFSGNSTTSGGGGGISNYSATVNVTNSTFSGNTGFYAGGGILNAGGGASLTLTNTTFSGNSASEGGGVYTYPDAALTLENTIVANSPSGGNCFGPINDGGGNLQHPGTDCGATITSADPLLDPAGLQDNGGPTETITLQPGSPAINAAVLANCPPTDQRGEERPQGAACDIGAVELVIGHLRPKSATPLRISLVPAYLACSSPNRTHGPSLAHPSCAPPAKLSQYATVGTPDANLKPAGSTGSVRIAALVGDPFTPGDQADVSLVTNVTDVRAAADLSDYDGELLVAVGMRITDKLNGPSLVEPGTVVDSALSWPVQCVPTADPNIGSTCASATTADALVPGTVDEGKRAVWALKQVQVADGGDDGQAVTTGDNTPFLKQGVFIP